MEYIAENKPPGTEVASLDVVAESRKKDMETMSFEIVKGKITFHLFYFHLRSVKNNILICAVYRTDSGGMHVMNFTNVPQLYFKGRG